jgi:hypothetical protein
VRPCERTSIALKTAGFADASRVEPTGIEPVTSCLQSARSPREPAAESGRLAGILRTSSRSEIRADAHGLSAIIVVSGTSRDKCLAGDGRPMTLRVRRGSGERPRSHDDSHSSEQRPHGSLAGNIEQLLPMSTAHLEPGRATRSATRRAGARQACQRDLTASPNWTAHATAAR